MSALTNAKHERMAQELAMGLSADKAYAQAGYKPHRGNAARLSAKEHIKARVAELQQIQVKTVHEFTAINVREQMHKLMEIRDDALAAGDIKTAADIQKFIMKMFGFEDMPTLTHEMLGERGAQTMATPSTEERQGEPARKNILWGGRVHQKLIELAGPRKIDHETTKD